MQYDGIAGKVAIVTGSGGGIGEGYAKGLAAHGAHVFVAEINSASGERVASEINASGGKADFVQVDVGSESSTRAMAEHVEKLKVEAASRCRPVRWAGVQLPGGAGAARRAGSSGPRSSGRTSVPSL